MGAYPSGTACDARPFQRTGHTMIDFPPPSSGRPPLSSRGSRKAYDSISVTAESGFMKQMLDAAMKAAKKSLIIPLVINNEENRELGSFGRKVMQRVERALDLEIIDPGVRIPLDPHFYELHGLMVVSGSNVAEDAWTPVAEATAAARLFI